MSTRGSPRHSIASARSHDSSRRQSFETASRSSSRPPPATARRNRAALRDYYGLKSPDTRVESPKSPQNEDIEVKESEFDQNGFDPENYVKELMKTESLEGILRVEGRLVNEIKSLDGERKALVYDNYSKLIAATDTIRKMRLNMDPLTPTTSTLAPAISHIAETAAALATSMKEHHAILNAREYEGRTNSNMRNQVQTVRWVLDAPRRFRKMMGEGRETEVRAEWKDVSRLLDHWDGVEGVTEVRNACEEALNVKS